MPELAWIIVSPTGAPRISLMLAHINPTCPECNSCKSVIFGEKTPILSTVCFSFFVNISIVSPFFIDPFTTLTNETTPR